MNVSGDVQNVHKDVEISEVHTCALVNLATNLAPMENHATVRRYIFFIASAF